MGKEDHSSEEDFRSEGVCQELVLGGYRIEKKAEVPEIQETQGKIGEN